MPVPAPGDPAIVRRSRYGDTHSLEVRENKAIQRFTQVWDVFLGDTDPDPISGPEIRYLAGLPRAGRTMYSPRPGIIIPFAYCKSVTPVPDQQNRRIWHVSCSFELEGNEEGEPKPDDEDPMNLSPKIEPFCDSTEVVMLRDWDGNLIVDPFGEPYDEPVMAPIPLPGVRVKRFVSSYDENTLADWLHTTNEATWRGKPAGAWAIRSVVGSEVEYGSYTIGQLEFEIVSHPLELDVRLGDTDKNDMRVGWFAVRAARSIQYKDDADVLHIHRKAQAGPPSECWIDADGHKVDDPYFVAYRNRRKKDFEEIVAS